ncbi:MAG TPA: cytochrome c peroxidase [Gemmatimonadaceae bacterium]
MTISDRWCVSLLLFVAACGGDAAGGITANSEPTVLGGSGAVAATVGAALSYDATRGGNAFTSANGALTYSVAFEGPANGLTASGGTITGTPTAPGITFATITATDPLGRSARDRLAIVAFTGGLLEPALPVPSLQYGDVDPGLPAHFRATIGGASVLSLDNTPATNPITDAGGTLGRVLFYDPRLSANDAVRCGSCHHQSLGFSDALAFSVGLTGALTPRHATGLANARFYRRGRFFWDERAATLEDQVLEPIQNDREMGMSLDALAIKLSATRYYPQLFNAAFGSPDITRDRIARALAQFTRAMVSGDSRYDRAFDANGAVNLASTLTPQEIDGERVFRQSGCASCHTTLVQVGDAPHNNGLDAVPTDTGVGGGVFKTPSLRNVAVRKRFMHDGRFASLDEVVAFYDSGIRDNPRLDPRLRAADGTPKRLGLTAVERDALVAFLGALTDSTFLTSPRFSDPFAPDLVRAPIGPTITMQGNAFSPALVTVPAGAVVSFLNIDNEWHNATFDSPAIVSTPKFTSGIKTVTMPMSLGAYTYHCTVHGVAMSGAIIVGK